MGIENHAEWRAARMRAVANIVREVRQARGMSQEQAAIAAGVAVYTYGRLERGGGPRMDPTNPTLDTLLRVMGALGVRSRSTAGIDLATKLAVVSPSEGIFLDIQIGTEPRRV